MSDGAVYSTGIGLAIVIGMGVGYIKSDIKHLEEIVQPKLQIKNVIGKAIPDKFYEIDGRKVYLEIDGKPIEDYFSR